MNRMMNDKKQEVRDKSQCVKTNYDTFLYIIFVLLIFTQCKDQMEVTDQMVQKKLNEMRENLIKERIEDCNKMLMKQIEEEVDSILIYKSKRDKYDSLTVPHDSVRPEKPELKFPEYKKPVRPGTDTLKNTL